MLKVLLNAPSVNTICNQLKYIITEMSPEAIRLGHNCMFIKEGELKICKRLFLF